MGFASSDPGGLWGWNVAIGTPPFHVMAKANPDKSRELRSSSDDQNLSSASSIPFVSLLIVSEVHADRCITCGLSYRTYRSSFRKTVVQVFPAYSRVL
jgi:hypothetical protein